ncbi:YdgA family protein [Parachitinimonas caeni]|uniref:YdgA family protein n=1 Tax=Parachitinimonas caeni TaxID=3031301 RepID=A0ABT7DTX3_9NEIS|nr:YdgA family protein [Parachitinimonas caeni]MDK2123530.1 YdgA family protein [Parachitinimonas caeni]
MKKSLLIIPGVIVLAGAGWLGATAWAGKTAQETLEKQHKMLADLPYFVVKKHNYQSGLFTSHERTTLALNPNLWRPYAEMLKLAGREIPELEFTYTQEIKHGPFPLIGKGDFTPLKAVVKTEFVFSPEANKWLTKLFGQQKPLEIENRIRFKEDGEFNIKVPGFTYEETIGKATWQGFDAKIVYGADFNSVDIEAKAPGIKLDAGTHGSGEIRNITFVTHNQRGASGIMLGDGKLSLEAAQFELKDEHKISAKLSGLTYVVKSAAQGDFINSAATVDLTKLELNDKTYGPAKLAVEANHLHAPTLAKLNKSVNALQKQQYKDAAELNTKMFDVVKAEGLPLLRNDPALALRQLSVKLPEGEVSLRADVAMKGFVDADISEPLKLINKLTAKADLTVPKKVIETLVLMKARSQIATDTADGQQPDTTELDQLARNLMENQIKKLAEQKLIQVDGESLITSASWKDGKLTVNGTEFPLPWQTPPDAGGEADIKPALVQ